MAEIGNMIEEWRTVPEFPNYEVSNFGNVRSKDRISIRNGNPAKLKGQLLKQKSDNGYMRVTFYSGNREQHQQYSVHRLVASLFIPNPDNLPCINHKDENRSNNHVSNLEWCTYKYNSNYGTAITRRVKHQDWESIANKQAIPIEQCDKQGNVIHRWPSMMECYRKTGFQVGKISLCCNGKRKTHKGYTWRIAI